MKRTENGALGYSTSNHILLDMLFKMPSYRNDTNALKKDFALALQTDMNLALKFMFYTGDIRQGLGERKTFVGMLRILSEVFPNVACLLIPYIPEYNRWKTLFDAFISPHVVEYEDNEYIVNATAEYIRQQLQQDLGRYCNCEPVSLLAKWMPSLNASNKAQREMAGWLRRRLNMSPKEYRCSLKDLRSYIDVVESKMCAGRWGEINYSHVPAKANLNYKNAFLEHDFVRRTTYLNDVANGKQKMHADILYPCDIVHQYMQGEEYWYEAYKVDSTLELAWKNLKDVNFGKNEFDCLVVVDGSGSMYQRVRGGSLMLSITVAHSLAIYCSERLSGPFKNKFITFSNNPCLVELDEDQTLLDKIHCCQRYDEVASTNLEKVFDLILQEAIANHVSQDEIPSNLMIISDMEFNDAMSGSVDEILLSHLRQKFESNGYHLPRIIFWNVGSRTNTIPMIENPLGIVLIGGYSTNLLKMVLGNELDPYKNLLSVLNGERYKPIEVYALAK